MRVFNVCYVSVKASGTVVWGDAQVTTDAFTVKNVEAFRESTAKALGVLPRQVTIVAISPLAATEDYDG